MTFWFVVLVLAVVVLGILAGFYRGVLVGQERGEPATNTVKVIREMQATHDAAMTMLAGSASVTPPPPPTRLVTRTVADAVEERRRQLPTYKPEAS